MSGIIPAVLGHVTRIRVTFQDDIGNNKTILGTGFWIGDKNARFFVTNRHNLDAKMKLGHESRFMPINVEIQLRRIIGRNYYPETNFFRVSDFAKCLRIHQSADVAILHDPRFEERMDGFEQTFFYREDLATAEFLSNHLFPMDIASFLGFPGRNGQAWWDELWQFPIARTVNLASWPKIPFTNASIPTSDIMLVSGLSFSGSSGSPVISHQKGIKLGNGLSGGGYVSPKLIGIMSGHWWNEDPIDGMFFHSGLSYLTRSTSIIELLSNL